MFFVGFQEVVNLNAKNLLFETDTNKKILLAKIAEALPETYELVV